MGDISDRFFFRSRKLFILTKAHNWGLPRMQDSYWLDGLFFKTIGVVCKHSNDATAVGTTWEISGVKFFFERTMVLHPASWMTSNILIKEHIDRGNSICSCCENSILGILIQVSKSRLVSRLSKHRDERIWYWAASGPQISGRMNYSYRLIDIDVAKGSLVWVYWSLGTRL